MRDSGRTSSRWHLFINNERGREISRDPGSNPGRAISADSMKKEMVWKNLGSSSWQGYHTITKFKYRRFLEKIMAKEEKSEGKEIGRVSSYFSHVKVAAIQLSGKLKIGDKVHIKGHTTDFEVSIDGIQIERKDVKEADKGDHIGIKVPEKVRPNDKVFLVE